jgi:hypothetical protein
LPWPPNVSLDAVLHRIVDGLARQRAVALARVWLLKPGGVCENSSAPPSGNAVHVNQRKDKA